MLRYDLLYLVKFYGVLKYFPKNLRVKKSWLNFQITCKAKIKFIIMSKKKFKFNLHLNVKLKSVMANVNSSNFLQVL